MLTCASPTQGSPVSIPGLYTVAPKHPQLIFSELNCLFCRSGPAGPVTDSFGTAAADSVGRAAAAPVRTTEAVSSSSSWSFVLVGDVVLASTGSNIHIHKVEQML